MDVVDGSSFSQALFNDEKSVEIRNAAIKTEFIKGMVEATLNANYYGGYMVQDAAYCFSAVKTFGMAAKNCEKTLPKAFSSLYEEQSKLLEEYNDDFVKTWHLKSADSIDMGTAAKTYVEYEGRVSRDSPKFLAIAMLPCHMLWPWIANQLIDFVGEWNPYFKGWFKDNKTEPNHKGHLEKFVDSHFDRHNHKERKKALTIFREGMNCELNFFEEACAGCKES